MSLVTPKNMRAAYVLLRQLPPFSRWKLPSADEVRFELVRDPTTAADYVALTKHRIRLHPHLHCTLEELLASVAHEMVHMRQQVLGRLPIEGDGHNADFMRMAHQVSRALGFKVQGF